MTNSERVELPRYREVCSDAGVPLVVIDDAEAGRALPFLDELGPVDLLVSLSWRRVVAPQALARFGVARLNLHRGRLPGYEGARPVERMLEDGCDEAVITAHEMVAKVDAGRIVATVHIPVNRDVSLTPAEQAERIKEVLLPLYPPLLNLALDSVITPRMVPGAAFDGERPWR